MLDTPLARGMKVVQRDDAFAEAELLQTHRGKREKSTVVRLERREEIAPIVRSVGCDLEMNLRTLDLDGRGANFATQQGRQRHFSINSANTHEIGVITRRHIGNRHIVERQMRRGQNDEADIPADLDLTARHLPGLRLEFAAKTVPVDKGWA